MLVILCFKVGGRGLIPSEVSYVTLINPFLHSIIPIHSTYDILTF
jgi:hypothetical protein